MGTVRRRRETGLLFLDLRHQGHRHRLQTRLLDTAANRRSLGVVLARIERDRVRGVLDLSALAPWTTPQPGEADASFGNKRGTFTFTAFAILWESWHSPTWRPATRASVATSLRKYLVPALGACEVASITRARILELRATLAQQPGGRGGRPLAGRTINRHLGVLRAILAEAGQQLGFPDPSAGIRRLLEPRHAAEPFSGQEVSAILAAAPRHYRPYLTTRFFCGLRSSEADGLRWTDINLTRNELQVSSTLSRGRRQATKTPASARTIPLPAIVHHELESLARHVPAPAPGDLVFRTASGAPMHADNFCSRVWKPLLAQAGVRYRRPYVMRHTCATLMLGSGENVEFIARTLGHTTTRLLFSTYSQYVPNLTRRDGSAFDRLLEHTVHPPNEPAPTPADSRAIHIAPARLHFEELQ